MGWGGGTGTWPSRTRSNPAAYASNSRSPTPSTNASTVISTTSLRVGSPSNHAATWRRAATLNASPAMASTAPSPTPPALLGHRQNIFGEPDEVGHRPDLGDGLDGLDEDGLVHGRTEPGAQDPLGMRRLPADGPHRARPRPGVAHGGGRHHQVGPRLADLPGHPLPVEGRDPRLPAAAALAARARLEVVEHHVPGAPVVGAGGERLQRRGRGQRPQPLARRVPEEEIAAARLPVPSGPARTTTPSDRRACRASS